MKYYININKELFGIEQGQEFLVKSDWIECQAQEDGLPYSIYNTDGTPNLEAIQVQQEANELSTKIAEAKQYLASTDFKVLPDYDKEPTEVIAKRAESREFIRANQGVIDGL